MINHHTTASQTVGPFFHDCLLRADAQRAVLVTPETVGQRIRITGRITDGGGSGVDDALIELWQANSDGRYKHPLDTRNLPLDPTFLGYGRAATQADGSYTFETIKPGRVPFRDGLMQAPHINLAVFGRGLLNHLYTRLYFADDPATPEDPLLQLIPAEWRATLLAQPDHHADIVLYRFDIVLQGVGETVFFQL